MSQDVLLTVVIGMFMFLVYWGIHTAFAFAIKRDCANRGMNILPWVSGYLALSFVNMIVWITFLVLSLTNTFSFQTGLIYSVLVMLFSIPSIFIGLLYLASRKIADVTYPLNNQGNIIFSQIPQEGVDRTKTVRFKGSNADDACFYFEGKVIGMTSGQTTIGRDFNSNIAIDNEYVSNDHAIVSRSNGHYYIADLNTPNKTFIDRDGMTQEVKGNAEIKHNDYIKFGPEVKMQFLVKGK